MSLATFWALFSQAHLVTLVGSKKAEKNRVVVGGLNRVTRRVCEKMAQNEAQSIFCQNLTQNGCRGKNVARLHTYIFGY
jgi:hypothetical protein